MSKILTLLGISLAFMFFLFMMPLLGGIITAVTAMPGCDTTCSTVLNSFPTVLGLALIAGAVLVATRSEPIMDVGGA